jgi:uncharacterized protein YcbK (DUF882 family)
MTKITEHFTVEEFACRDGSPYPPEWIDERLKLLCEVLETVRAAAGGMPLRINSGYRTLAYDERLYEASAKDGSVAPASRSQHPQGRAADVTHPMLKPAELFNLVLDLYGSDKLPLLGGCGLYPGFVHLDVRPRVSNHLAIWGGHRPSNVV